MDKNNVRTLQIASYHISQDFCSRTRIQLQGNAFSHIENPIGTSAAICSIVDMLGTLVRALKRCVFLAYLFFHTLAGMTGASLKVERINHFFLTENTLIKS
jgi:hypothetical protein